MGSREVYVGVHGRSPGWTRVLDQERIAHRPDGDGTAPVIVLEGRLAGLGVELRRRERRRRGQRRAARRAAAAYRFHRIWHGFHGTRLRQARLGSTGRRRRAAPRVGELSLAPRTPVSTPDPGDRAADPLVQHTGECFTTNIIMT